MIRCGLIKLRVWIGWRDAVLVEDLNGRIDSWLLARNTRKVNPSAPFSNDSTFASISKTWIPHRRKPVATAGVRERFGFNDASFCESPKGRHGIVTVSPVTAG